MRTRVKICGITRVEDGAAAIAAGADAVGLVFWSPSRRYVEPEIARQVALLPGPFCARVGVFVDPEAVLVRQVLRQVPLTHLQFHGDEQADFCGSFGLPYVKALRMRDTFDLDQAARDYRTAQGLLLDSFVPGMPGGTGQSFAWERARYTSPVFAGALPIVLAGGLDAQNVTTAISIAKPYGVDVSGSVEEPAGLKNSLLIKQFCGAVWAAGSRNLPDSGATPGA